MKQSGVTFNFESFEKGTPGIGTIILTPTIHISKSGEVSIYCINDEGKKYNQVRFSKVGDVVGIEFSDNKEYNSYSFSKRNGCLRGKIMRLPRYLDLEHFFGTEFHSGNFPLYQESENVWWFDLKEAHSKNKPLNKKNSNPIKSLRK